MVLLIILLKAALRFESVDEILNCGRLNETKERYFPFAGSVFYAARGRSFESVRYEKSVGDCRYKSFQATFNVTLYTGHIQMKPVQL